MILRGLIGEFIIAYHYIALTPASYYVELTISIGRELPRTGRYTGRAALPMIISPQPIRARSVTNLPLKKRSCSPLSGHGA